MDRFYLGTFTYAIDVQRRLPLPKEWRVGEEAPSFVLLPGRDRVVHAMPVELFKSSLLEKAKQVSITDPVKSRALAQMGAIAHHTTLDPQGRIKLTPLLMNHAGLSGEVVLVGGMTTIQLMAPETWQAASADIDSVLDHINQAEQLGQI